MSKYCLQVTTGGTVHVDLTSEISEILRAKTGAEFLKDLEEYRIGVKAGRKYCYELTVSDFLVYVHLPTKMVGGKSAHNVKFEVAEPPTIDDDVSIKFEEVGEHDIWVTAHKVVIPFLDGNERD